MNVEDLKVVIDFELSKVRERLLEKGLKLVLSDEAKKWLIKRGTDTDFGARPLRRAIDSFVQDPLSEEILKGEFNGKDTILVDVKEVAGKKQLTFTGSVGEPELATAGVTTSTGEEVTDSTPEKPTA